VTNIVMCFDSTTNRPDQRDTTNAEALLRLLYTTDPGRQIIWYHPGDRTLAAARARSPRRRRELAIEQARAGIVDAYEFLAFTWRPGDRIFLFGIARGAYCACALARLLGTVGVVPPRSDSLRDYVLATYAVPRTHRTPRDWRQVTRLASRLVMQREIAVPVQFLGLWDMVSLPGLSRVSAAQPLANVVAGRHAVAIDGGYGPFSECLLVADSERVDEVWFRGAHCDITGNSPAGWPLASLTLDWMLDGATAAGLIVRPGGRNDAPTPTVLDALAEGARTISLRKVPANALVHASVDTYLRAHPSYWRRLPAHVVWADVDWAARSERLIHIGETAPAVVEPYVVVAAAS
jgi:uncharacterized protein (DUF2235 family)